MLQTQAKSPVAAHEDVVVTPLASDNALSEPKIAEVRVDASRMAAAVSDCC